MNQILFSKKCIEDYEFESIKNSDLIPFRIGRRPKNEDNLNVKPKLLKNNSSAPRNLFVKTINKTLEIVN